MHTPAVSTDDAALESARPHLHRHQEREDRRTRSLWHQLPRSHGCARMPSKVMRRSGDSVSIWLG